MTLLLTTEIAPVSPQNGSNVKYLNSSVCTLGIIFPAMVQALPVSVAAALTACQKPQDTAAGWWSPSEVLGTPSDPRSEAAPLSTNAPERGFLEPALANNPHSYLYGCVKCALPCSENIIKEQDKGN